MDIPPAVLLVLAGGFALVNGANDGGTLVATGLKVSSIRPVTALLLLSTAVGVVPWLLGTRVATTLVTGIAPFEGEAGRAALVAAIVAAVATVALLSWRGLPTSLTLAVVGGLAGAALVHALPVSWGVVGGVLLAAAVAPVAGSVIAFLLGRGARHVPALARSGAVLRRGHWVTFPLQALAYAANDGQKMLAVFAVAAGAGGAEDPDPAVLAASAVLFGVGVIVGLPRFASTVGGGLLSLRPVHAVAAEVSASTAVLSAAALGAPVSMTQAVSAALVGAGAAESYRKVRWQAASKIVLAWVCTLPSAFVIATALGALLRGLG